MNILYLVLAGDRKNFRICAAFDIAAHAKSFAEAFRHHSEPLWVEEVPEGLDQDFRVGDMPYTVRFNRKGECLGVVDDPPLDDFLGHSPPPDRSGPIQRRDLPMGTEPRLGRA